jgi:hypothetical protein
MKILRAYQLDIIFLYFALLTFLGIALFILEETGVDAHVFEWYAAAPILVFYIWRIWKKRASIQLSQRRALTSKTLCYWLSLGATLFLGSTYSIPVTEYASIYLFFAIFTVLLADSYWDFKKISLKRLFAKQV